MVGFIALETAFTNLRNQGKSAPSDDHRLLRPVTPSYGDYHHDVPNVAVAVVPS